jgi:alkylation response protein AidB-like acyl-CoA dehydrogenase
MTTLALTSSFAAARGLELELGDPRDPARAFSFANALADDEREAFPAAACAELDRVGMPARYVPAAYGGTLERYDELLHLMRMVARRDLTAAIGHGKTFLGAVCVWVGGSPEQATALGARIRDGAIVSLALTERAHGSDLLAGDVRAERDAGGYRLTGEKWLINNATRGDMACVLAATGPQGPRGLSLLLVDKHALASGQFHALPKVRTHGIRGADISGFALQDAGVGSDALVGAEGAGLEILLKSLQITRTMCASLSLGAADTALRLAVRFAHERELYGRTLIDIPSARRTLAGAYADVLLAEVVATTASRTLDVAPEEASLSAAVAKYLVPTTVDRMVGRLGQLLGARSFLKDVYELGLFQKLERDQRIVGLFDGNTVVNLQSIIHHGPVLARTYGRPAEVPAGLFSSERPPAALDPRRLRLMARGTATVLRALPGAVTRLDGRTANLARRIERITAEVHAQLATTGGAVDAVPVASFRLAERYALCYAAAACIQTWLHVHDGDWLDGVLARILSRLDGLDEQLSAITDELLEPLLAQSRDARLFSLADVQLSEAPAC